MRAVLVKNDEDATDLIELEVEQSDAYVVYKGRVYEYVGTQDGRRFYSDL